MPIASYLVHPVAGQRDQVLHDLAAQQGCEVYPAQNSDLLVLLTDTPDELAERALARRLADIRGITCLSMVYGHLEEDVDSASPRHTGGDQ